MGSMLNATREDLTEEVIEGFDDNHLEFKKDGTVSAAKVTASVKT